MNPHITAQHLAAQGRGKDSMLVHMEPKEVAGLESLARMHGGHLSINPETGLPEAGFLSKVLGGLNDATGGLAGPILGAIGASYGLDPAMIGLGWGGANAIASGSLGKGLMAGLGAYGGANIAQGLSGAASDMNTMSGLDAAMKEAGVTDPSQLTADQVKAAGSSISSKWDAMSPMDKLSAGAKSAYGSGKLMDTIGAKNLLMVGAPLIASAAGSTATKLPADPATQYGGIKSLGHWDSQQNRFVPGGYTRINALGQATGTPFDVPAGANGGQVQGYDAGGTVNTVTKMPGDDSKAAMAYLMGGPNPFMLKPYTPPPAAVKKPADIVAPVDTTATTTSTKKETGPQDTGGSPAAPGPTSTSSVTGGPIGMSDVLGSLGAMLGISPSQAAMATVNAQNQAQNQNDIQASQDALANDAAAQGLADAAATGNPSGGNDGGGGSAGNPVAKGGIIRAANGGIMSLIGGMSNLGHYSDGGQLLKGPGDGVSDDIPAQIGEKQPARLADGEFVIPARIVSEIGNGSTDAGARRLYQMMDRIQAGRAKTVGKGRVAVDSKAERHLPA